MCAECGRTPCHPRCPNAGDPPIFAECDLCGYEIYDGADYYQIGDYRVCEACVEKSQRTAEVGYED